MLGPSPYGTYTVIGGFEYVANYLFTSQADIGRDNSIPTDQVTGALANQFMSLNSSDLSEFYWSDPSDYMINQLRQIAFRASLQAAKDNATASNATQTVAYAGKKLSTIYVTNFTLVAVAVCLNLAAVVSVTATFWGWWALGRSFTRSPLETARAFDAPLLRDVDDHVVGVPLSTNVRNRRVKLGTTDNGSGSGSSQLKFVRI